MSAKANAKLKQVAGYFIGAAQRASNPLEKANALREGAVTFSRLASDPRNVRAAKKLTAIGLEFVGAASKAQQAVVTDFDDLLRITADAWEDLGQDAAFGQGDMAVAAVSRDLAQSDSSADAKIVSIAPDSFNKDATLGRVVTVKYAPSELERSQGIVQSQTVAFWQGSKREAQAMTVDVGPTLLPQVFDNPPVFSVNPIDARPYATIEYGSDGNRTNNIVIDVGAGRRVTVVGNYVSVIVGMDPPTPAEGPFPAYESAALTLGASIGTFAAPSQAPVMRTVWIDRMQNSQQTIVKPIPSRATLLHRPLFISTPSPTATVQFLDYGGNVIVTVPFNFTAGSTTPDPFPVVVPYNAYFFWFTRDSGSVVPVYAPFQLSL